ncbi:MAG: amino acid adenylation domain-containing protein [Chloroflexi bacterium]|nr:amino acid adenylation domain-containing protein [Chloroflexota bacterium]MCI0575001.1 amino acid adenylation domain-containing protein [Chloroflexota bacterium]MCI0645771.1 amino acid adenylation domain-containing protein [Chloroflexota bacterium]MCI0727698.1 amino acid adenylation domain-containing protein [Chloroflexota bacterium]
MAYLLQQLLTESAARRPEAEAARFQGEGLTYGQLDRLTNQVARALWSAGVQRGDRVGIYVHKSLAAIISVFGILKAGGVYVPLDPSAPTARLAYITRNCDVQVLLTSSEKLASLQDFFEAGTPLATAVLAGAGAAEAAAPALARLITWEEVCAQDDRPLPPGPTIETDLAYILYTSGSTGEPKGVMISHRTIFTFINWCAETFQISSADRVTGHAPLHFDLSTFDMYVTIQAGGTVVLVPEKLSVIPVQLAQLLQDERITVTYLVPSILSLMVQYGRLETHDFSFLRLVLFAGEVFPIKYLRRLVAAVPQADYYNLYGPTETNVCTYYKVQPHDLAPERTQPVPIGVACANMEVFAVDDQEQRVTRPGQEGELWVRGSCVAQGYWGDPEKTARNFVHNSFQQHFDEVAYRTGDIVTLDEDRTNWLYIGRRDHMVKSRGYRIELGEIEAALYSHSGVKEAAVIAVPDELIGSRLRAFVVASNGHDLTEKDIIVHCGRQLPRYMVPESVEFRSELPKTSTGKIDRPLLAQSAS